MLPPAGRLASHDFTVPPPNGTAADAALGSRKRRIARAAPQLVADGRLLRLLPGDGRAVAAAFPAASRVKNGAGLRGGADAAQHLPAGLAQNGTNQEVPR